MTSVRETLAEGTKKIGASEALWLLSGLLESGQSALLLRQNETLAAAKRKKYAELLKRRKAGEPLQYVLGTAPFYGRDFAVGPGVLVPRPETECLVQLALDHGDRLGSSLNVFDIGLGSGCIGLTLALERSSWRVAGSEPDAKALLWAKKNARRFSAARLGIFKDPFLNAVTSGKYPKPDLVIANPPYLDTKKDTISRQVLKTEPKFALLSPESGSWHAQQIFEQCLVLRPRLLVLELSARVAYILERRWKKAPQISFVRRERDLAGRARFLVVGFQRG